jgi:hypothetical protein
MPTCRREASWKELVSALFKKGLGQRCNRQPAVYCAASACFVRGVPPLGDGCARPGKNRTLGAIFAMRTA